MLENIEQRPSEENIQKDYEILEEKHRDIDLIFKLIVIGNSGNLLI